MQYWSRRFRGKKRYVILCICKTLLLWFLIIADLHVQPAQWGHLPELWRLSLRHASVLEVSLPYPVLTSWVATDFKKTIHLLTYWLPRLCQFITETEMSRAPTAGHTLPQWVPQTFLWLPAFWKRTRCCSKKPGVAWWVPLKLWFTTTTTIWNAAEDSLM